MKKKTVAVIFGGKSGEHEVSLVSARAIMHAMDRTRFAPLPVLITKDGAWKVGKRARPGKLVLEKGRLNGKRVDAAFPIVHGTYGEDGRLQGLLDMADIPYVGCDVYGSAVGMDKDVAKRLLEQAGIPTALGFGVCDADWKQELPAIKKRIAKTLKYPVFVKPARLGSSVGVVKVKAEKELEKAMRTAFVYDEKILIEGAVPQAREIECAVLGNGPYEVAGPGEVIPAGEFYDFNDKYVDGQSTAHIPAQLPPKLAKSIRQAAIDACATLGVHGMARVDFLLPKSSTSWVLNEINTLPGFTSISMYPKLWAHEGLPFKRLVTKLINLALARHKKLAKKSYGFVSGSDWYV